MEKQIRKTWFFPHSPQEVWDYLTKPELIELWLMKTNFQPVKGKKFQFTFDPKPGSKYEGLVQCEVLEIQPYTKLAYSWNGGTPDKSRSFKSVVEWTLEPRNNGTELRLAHDGFELLEDILAHTSGWENCLKKFEENINSK
jgi:uncharacterized protein YndB with AHSA1/START domain